jgi:hypothetical protein
VKLTGERGTANANAQIARDAFALPVGRTADRRARSCQLMVNPVGVWLVMVIWPDVQLKDAAMVKVGLIIGWLGSNWTCSEVASAADRRYAPGGDGAL